MYITRVRFWLLALLLFLYLAGVLILSAVTLHDTSNSSSSASSASYNNLKYSDRHHYGKNFEYAITNGVLASGLRPPLRRSKIQWCSSLKYVEPPREAVALASFPGSGNTWLRYLLQQATGLYTGSVYKDYGLLKNGFPAESVVNGSVLVVKTHEWGENARRAFRRAVLLVRSPSASIQAEFNRQSGGHIGFASPDRYKRTKGKVWQQFVSEKLQAWNQTNLDWLYNFTGPTHVIFYEQLVDNLERTLRSVVDFLNVPLDPVQFKCAMDRKEGIYRRKKRVLNFDPYNQEMKKRMRLVQQRVYDAIYNFATPTR